MNVSRAVRWLPLLLLLALSVAACNRRGDWRMIQLYGGEGSVAILKEPHRVEVFRIEPTPRPDATDIDRVGEFPVVGDPVVLGDAESSRLCKILLDPATYDFWRTKPDPFVPTIGVRVRRGTSFIDIAVCRESNMILIYRYGRRVGAEDYDAARGRILDLLDAALAE